MSARAIEWQFGSRQGFEGEREHAAVHSGRRAEGIGGWSQVAVQLVVYILASGVMLVRAGRLARSQRRRASEAWLTLGCILLCLCVLRTLGVHTFLTEAARELAQSLGMYEMRRSGQTLLIAGTALAAVIGAGWVFVRARFSPLSVTLGCFALLVAWIGAREVSLHAVDQVLGSDWLGQSLGAWGEVLLLAIMTACAAADTKPTHRADGRYGMRQAESGAQRRNFVRWIGTFLTVLAMSGGLAGVSKSIEATPGWLPVSPSQTTPNLTGGTMLWWEAENATGETFGNPWDFRPTTPEQQNALSGGNWLQTAKGSGVTARWKLRVPNAGTYRLWTRKFYKHGPFRYRFGSQEWTHVGRDVELTDEVVVREKVVANWVDLGLVTLPAGDIDFDVVGDVGISAIAFDCWVLDGSGDFKPSGKQRPPEAIDAMAPPPIGAANIRFDQQDFLWWEAEDADAETFGNPPGFRAEDPKVKELLSGGDWLQTGKGSTARASWSVDVTRPGTYTFWARKFWKHGPFRYRWNYGQWVSIGRDVDLADSVPLWRGVEVNWVLLGAVDLPMGPNKLEIEGQSDATAMAFDCFLLTQKSFAPRGKLKPGEGYNVNEPGWFAWEPERDTGGEKALDLRFLNQKRAGDDGFVVRRGDEFAFEKTGEPVRFWGVGANAATNDKEGVKRLAKLLASLGVNAVRTHRFIADRSGDDPFQIDERYLDQLHYFVAAMAEEGIFTDISFYYPIWMRTKPSDDLPGYKVGQQPFGLLFWDERMQSLWKTWARELLTRPNPYTGKSLAEDPAVAIVEIINEDSLFFWTFDPEKRIPPDAMKLLEMQFGNWASERYGSIGKALDTWGRNPHPASPDVPSGGRLGLYQVGFLGGANWAVTQRNTARARDQLEFMARLQRGFYQTATDYLRNDLGVRCAIQASNWKTADDRVLSEVERWTYEPAGVIGRNAYFGGPHEGEASSYSLRKGQTYSDRTGLRGDGAPATIAFEVSHAGYPQIVTEYGYPMPNAYRAEGAFLAAVYGSLHGTDGIFHFAMDGTGWDQQEQKFSLATPVTLGQFPALSLAYRQGYIEQGDVAFSQRVSLEDLFASKGTAVWQSPNLDAFRATDVKPGTPEVIADPTALVEGRAIIDVAGDGEHDAEANGPKAPASSAATGTASDRTRARAGALASNTHQIRWDTHTGVVRVDTPCAQGVCGFLGEAGLQETTDFVFDIKNEYASVMIVSLDGKPLAESGRALLQIVSTEKNAGWNDSGGAKREILDVGSPPVMVKEIDGVVHGRGRRWEVNLLSAAGRAEPSKRPEPAGNTGFRLDPHCLWYELKATP